EERRWRPSVEAGRVRHPPGLRSELDDVLLALLVDHVIPEAAAGDERRVARDVAGPLEKFTRSERLEEKCRPNDIEVGLRKRRPPREVRAKHVECRRGDRSSWDRHGTSADYITVPRRCTSPFPLGECSARTGRKWARHVDGPSSR